DDDRPDRGHAHAHPQRQLGVPRERDHAAQQAQGPRGAGPARAGLHRRLPHRGRHRRAVARGRPEVRPEPRAQHRRHQARVEAGPARLREVRRAPAGARRPRRRDHLDVLGPADRPPGTPATDGRGSPRLRLV
ncbi:MAG: SSU ribosomal protein S8p (S15Ae), partial [uncultured Actinomycetospora sp.]